LKSKIAVGNLLPMACLSNSSNTSAATRMTCQSS
jgi:hypothetical protein